MSRLLLGLLLLLGPAVTAAGQTRLEAHLSADTVAVGERFRLTLLVERPAAARLTVPTDSLLGDLYVVEGPLRYSHLLGGDRLRDSIVYMVTTFALDSARVPPLPLVLHSETERQILTTPPLQVVVRSMVPPDASGIRDLAPLIEFPTTPWPWLAGAALLAVLLGLAAYLWQRRQRPPLAPPSLPPEPQPDPYLAALQQLAALALLAEQTPVKAFYVTLADVLREYLEARLDLPARKMTTRELTTRLEQHPARHVAGLALPIRRVLETADLVKFAGRTYPIDYNLQLLSIARTLVERLELSIQAAAPIQPNALATPKAYPPSS